MYKDMRPDRIARVIVGILPIVGYDPEAAVREAFDPQLLDPGIVFRESYLDALALACYELYPAILPSQWIAALYKVNEERKIEAPGIAAQAGIPKWMVGVAVFLAGLLLVSKKRS